MLHPTFDREALARGQNLWPVAGVDEVGRGPLAGPVVAAAVILDPDDIPDGLADSKQLSATRRQQLYAEILRSALGIGIAGIGAREIDATNIRIATLKAARNAVAALPIRPRLVLIDGRDCCDVSFSNLPCTCEAIVRGDASVVSIAAASIVAKVTRDAMMARLARRWPQYGFDGHAGYATARHRESLAVHGPCPEHRFSFAPLKSRHTRGV